MSVLIKGMRMPENCVVCPMAENIPPGRTRCLLTRRLLADNYNPPAYERNEHCPLVDLGKHGRLIDADAFFDRFSFVERTVSFGASGLYVDIHDLYEILSSLPTVIEAEGEE